MPIERPHGIGIGRRRFAAGLALCSLPFLLVWTVWSLQTGFRMPPSISWLYSGSLPALDDYLSAEAGMARLRDLTLLVPCILLPLAVATTIYRRRRTWTARQPLKTFVPRTMAGNACVLFATYAMFAAVATIAAPHVVESSRDIVASRFDVVEDFVRADPFLSAPERRAATMTKVLVSYGVLLPSIGIDDRRRRLERLRLHETTPQTRPYVEMLDRFDRFAERIR